MRRVKRPNQTPQSGVDAQRLKHLQQLLAADQVVEAESLVKVLGLSVDTTIAVQCYDDWSVYCLHHGRADLAQWALNMAVQRVPQSAHLWNNLAIALAQLERYDEALAASVQAVSLSPKNASYHYNQGLTLRHLRRLPEALQCYQQSLNLEPHAPKTVMELHEIYKGFQQWALVLRLFETARKQGIKADYLPGNHLFACLKLTQWQDMEHLTQEVLAGIDQGQRVIHPGVELLAIPATSAQQLRCAQIFVADRHHGMPQPISAQRRSGRIRIAYVSTDFRQHPISYLTAGLLRVQDRQQFEVFLYSLQNAPEDLLQQKIRSEAEHFLDLSDYSDAQIVQRAREQDLDIAVDLNGYSGDARLNLFIQRLAPVQINYLGYIGSMGTPCHDYIIADSWVIPPQAQIYYSEKVVYLPSIWQINDDQRPTPLPRTRAEEGLPEAGVVLCSFNDTYKIHPMFFGLWMQLMRNNPAVWLWLLGEPAEVAVQLRNTAQQLGVNPQRLLFAQRRPYQEHLSRLTLADLVLDTLPFGGGTSTSDALWAGVPVLTCLGDTFAGRMSASLLRMAELPELIATSLEDYYQRAQQLIRDALQLSALRQRLNAGECRRRLFDTAQRTRELEQVYTDLFQRSARMDRSD